MDDAFRSRDWEKRLRPFDRVWDRVQGGRPARPLPPPPPPMFGPPPPPPPGPPLMPGRGCCSRAARFNPFGNGRRY